MADRPMTESPGTAEARLRALLDALRVLFPEVKRHTAKAPDGEYIARLTAQAAELARAETAAQEWFDLAVAGGEAGANFLRAELLQEKATAAHWKEEAEKLRTAVNTAGKALEQMMDRHGGSNWREWDGKLDDKNDPLGMYRRIFSVLRVAGLLPEGEEAKW